jgi:hypothetical protein
MHAALLDRAKLLGQRRVHCTGACDTVHAAESIADQQHAVMGLAGAALRSHMTRVMRTVVSHLQHCRRESGGKRGSQTVSAISFHAHSLNRALYHCQSPVWTVIVRA